MAEEYDPKRDIEPEEAEAEAPSVTEEVAAEVPDKPSLAPWFNPQTRKAIYSLSVALLPLITMLGLATEQDWVVITGVVLGVFDLAMASLHTHSPRSEAAA